MVFAKAWLGQVQSFTSIAGVSARGGRLEISILVAPDGHWYLAQRYKKIYRTRNDRIRTRLEAFLPKAKANDRLLREQYLPHLIELPHSGDTAASLALSISKCNARLTNIDESQEIRRFTSSSACKSLFGRPLPRRSVYINSWLKRASH